MNKTYPIYKDLDISSKKRSLRNLIRKQIKIVRFITISIVFSTIFYVILSVLSIYLDNRTIFYVSLIQLFITLLLVQLNKKQINKQKQTFNLIDSLNNQTFVDFNCFDNLSHNLPKFINFN